MTVLDARWFTGNGDMPEVLAEELETASFGYPTNAVLGKNGWDGESMVGVGLELSPDNRKVNRGQIIVRGKLSKEPSTFQATKLWDSASKELAVSITVPSGAEFDFAGGTMASEYLTSEGVKVVCSKGEQVILPTEWANNGVGEFCLRLFLQLAKPGAAGTRPAMRYTVMFFPHTYATMRDWSNMVDRAGWPGIKILEGEAQLFPAAREGDWGCPIYPVLCTGARFQQAPNLPSGQELRHSISSIMNTALQPLAYASHATLKRRWGKLLADNDEYMERTPATTWPPTTEQPGLNTGK